MKDDSAMTTYLLQCLMDNMSDMIYFKNRDSTFIMANKACAAWQGYCSPEEMIGKSDKDTYSAEDAERMRNDELNIMETGTPLHGMEERETWKNGAQAWVSTTKVPLRNAADEVIGIAGISRDITEHKEAEIRATRLAEENSRFREEMESDLLMASQLQKTFFPTSYPLFPAPKNKEESLVDFHHLHQSGGLVGGDLCSIRKLSDTEAGIFLCDVMGHGVRAALGTSIVRAVVEEISHQEKDPGQFLQHMNQILMPLFRKDDVFLFATACYLVLNVETGSVRFSIAGHPSPIVINHEANHVDWLVDPGTEPAPALAISDQPEYQTFERSLKPSDAMFMYTDGIYEVTDSNHEEFGEERLLASVRRGKDLSLESLFNEILSEAREFGAGNAFEDDICLVGFKMNPNA